MSCNVTTEHDKCTLHYITLHYFGVVKHGLMDTTAKALYTLYKTTEQLETVTNKMLSYRRETALQGGLVMAQNRRLELGDNI